MTKNPEDFVEVSKGDLEAGGGGVSEQGIKIVSWNINGMRTLNMNDVLEQLNCTVLAVQETKLARSNLDQSQVIPDGYSSYFSFSTNRIGYSGVATFCRNSWNPLNAEEGLCMPNQNLKQSVGSYPELNCEEESHMKYANADGRTVITQHTVMLPDGSHRPLTIINLYCPRLRDDPSDPTNNTDFKMTFHEVIHRRARLLVEAGSFVVLLGDINISHRWIDHCDGDPKTFVVTEFRKLLDDFLSESDSTTSFLDSFRHFHPHQESAFTCWNTRLNARENNYGTRIDYVFVDKQLSAYLEKAEIHTDIMGSDHCPISVTFKSLQPISQESLPSFATKYYAEFKGKQKNLKDFLLLKSQCSNQKIPKESDLNKNKNMTLSRKRRLEPDADTVVGKVVPTKKVQKSLHSFFPKQMKLENVKATVESTPEVEVSEITTIDNQQLTPSSSSSSSSSSCSSGSGGASKASDEWKKLMKVPQVPVCQGHQKACVKRTVKKKGLNFGREFWACSHGVGKSGDPNANCNFFQWLKQTSSKPSNK